MIRWEGRGGTCWTVYISRWVQGCIWTVGGGISGWMGGWVPGWKLLRNEGTLKDEWTGCFFSTPLCSPSQMNCSIFMSSLWSPYILSFFFFCFCHPLPLSSIVLFPSLHYPDHMSNSCGSVVWLINALRKSREVEHNKQTADRGAERKEERRGKERERERKREGGPLIRAYIKGLRFQREVLSPSMTECSLCLKFGTIMRPSTVWPISQQQEEHCEGTDGVWKQVGRKGGREKGTVKERERGWGGR